MFERFTQSARQVVVLAQEEARELGTIGIDLDDVRRRVEESFGTGALDRLVASRRHRRHDCDDVPSGHLPLTPRAK